MRRWIGFCSSVGNRFALNAFRRVTVFKGYGLSMNFEQYVLVGSTVRSYLSWLKDTGKLTTEFQDSMLLWQKV